MQRLRQGKYLLRHAFEGDWLPHDILMREKAAFSDAVGHSMVDDLKAYAEQKYTDEEFETCAGGTTLRSRSPRNRCSTVNCLSSITPVRRT